MTIRSPQEAALIDSVREIHRDVAGVMTDARIKEEIRDRKKGAKKGDILDQVALTEYEVEAAKRGLIRNPGKRHVKSFMRRNPSCEEFFAEQVKWPDGSKGHWFWLTEDAAIRSARKHAEDSFPAVSSVYRVSMDVPDHPTDRGIARDFPDLMWKSEMPIFQAHVPNPKSRKRKLAGGKVPKTLGRTMAKRKAKLKKNPQGVMVPKKDLPKALRDVLGDHKGRDIELIAAETFQPMEAAASGSGYQGYVTVVNLVTGESRTRRGDWGGIGLGTMAKRSRGELSLDEDNSIQEIPINGAVVLGQRGGTYPSARIKVHPETITAMLPDAVEVTPYEEVALGLIYGSKGSYRADQFHNISRQYPGLGEYSPDNPVIRSLEDKGLVKINKRGAISVTTAGKNASSYSMSSYEAERLFDKHGIPPEGRSYNPGGLQKDVKKLLKQAEKEGCTIIKGRKHYKVRCPEGRQFTVSASPSDRRAIHRIVRDFRNIAGIQVNPGYPTGKALGRTMAKRKKNPDKEWEVFTKSRKGFKITEKQEEEAKRRGKKLGEEYIKKGGYLGPWWNRNKKISLGKSVGDFVYKKLGAKRPDPRTLFRDRTKNQQFAGVAISTAFGLVRKETGAGEFDKVVDVFPAKNPKEDWAAQVVEADYVSPVLGTGKHRHLWVISEDTAHGIWGLRKLSTRKTKGATEHKIDGETLFMVKKGEFGSFEEAESKVPKRDRKGWTSNPCIGLHFHKDDAEDLIEALQKAEKLQKKAGKRKRNPIKVQEFMADEYTEYIKGLSSREMIGEMGAIKPELDADDPVAREKLFIIAQELADRATTSMGKPREILPRPKRNPKAKAKKKVAKKKTTKKKSRRRNPWKAWEQVSNGENPSFAWEFDGRSWRADLTKRPKYWSSNKGWMKGGFDAEVYEEGNPDRKGSMFFLGSDFGEMQQTIELAIEEAEDIWFDLSEARVKMETGEGSPSDFGKAFRKTHELDWEVRYYLSPMFKQGESGVYDYEVFGDESVLNPKKKSSKKKSSKKKTAKKKTTKKKAAKKKSAKKKTLRTRAKKAGRKIERGAKELAVDVERGAEKTGKKVKKWSGTKTGYATIGAGTGALLLGPLGAVVGAIGGSQLHENPDVRDEIEFDFGYEDHDGNLVPPDELDAHVKKVRKLASKIGRQFIKDDGYVPDRDTKVEDALSVYLAQQWKVPIDPSGGWLGDPSYGNQVRNAVMHYLNKQGYIGATVNEMFDNGGSRQRRMPMSSHSGRRTRPASSRPGQKQKPRSLWRSMWGKFSDAYSESNPEANPKKKSKKKPSKLKKKAKRAGRKAKKFAKSKEGYAAGGAGVGALLLGPLGAVAGAVGGSALHDNPGPIVNPTELNRRLRIELPDMEDEKVTELYVYYNDLYKGSARPNMEFGDEGAALIRSVLRDTKKELRNRGLKIPNPKRRGSRDRRAESAEIAEMVDFYLAQQAKDRDSKRLREMLQFLMEERYKSHCKSECAPPSQEEVNQWLAQYLELDRDDLEAEHDTIMSVSWYSNPGRKRGAKKRRRKNPIVRKLKDLSDDRVMSRYWEAMELVRTENDPEQRESLEALAAEYKGELDRRGITVSNPKRRRKNPTKSQHHALGDRRWNMFEDAWDSYSVSNSPEDLLGAWSAVLEAEVHYNHAGIENEEGRGYGPAAEEAEGIRAQLIERLGG